MRANSFAKSLTAATGIALVLSGCSKQPGEAPEATASAPAAAGPEAAPGITVSDAVVRLPAVSGNPGVAYFTIAQGSGAPRKIAAIHVEGVERAEMHESTMKGGIASMGAVTEVALEPGKAIQFAPGGYHVMLFGTAPTLKAGGTTELTVTLDDGDKVSVSAKVEGVGGGSDDMGGHDMKM
ncbi:copper chaperone PCu(A)C [Novosphingobium olei]|uniref:Copper chaperone PCu(A)C n=1 Tax=Novosphingobium olei TaxID=2728851 RepID=A0A7Y0GAL7_9SPHN|nr:copper chaperone PCu(A)C [Novosphingobium olei]NML94223.1 copper chaperone PCu(A)C [Novosphingobium olei]